MERKRFASSLSGAFLASASVLIFSGCATQEPQKSSVPVAPAAQIAVQPPTPAAPPPPPKPMTPQERLEALKSSLQKDAYEWRVYAEIGDIDMTLGKPREAAYFYERAIAVQPLSAARAEERKQAEFIAAQAKSEEARLKLQRQQAELQAQAAMMQGALGAFSAMPMGGSSNALIAQQSAAAMAQATSGAAGYASNMQAAGVFGIKNPSMSMKYSLPEKQEAASLWIKEGCACDAYGDHEKAIASFEQGFAIDPARVDALWLASVSLYELGQFQKAVITATRYASGIPCQTPLPACVFLGKSFQALGLQKQAEKAFSTAIAKSGSGPDAFLAAGGIKIRLGDSQGAAKDFETALSLRRGDTDALAGLSACRIALGDEAGLRAMLPEMKKSSSDFDDWYATARVEDWLGDSAASEDYAKSVKLWEASNQGAAKQPGIVAAARAGAGNPELGISLLKDSLYDDPCSPDAALDLYRLGLSYEKLSGDAARPDLAMDAFRQCLDDIPNFQLASSELKRLADRCAPAVGSMLARSDEALKAGDKAQALFFRSKAQALMPDGDAREKILREIAEIAGSMQQQPALPREAIEAWLSGNALIRGGNQNPADARRALLEFRRAANAAPWSATLMLSLASARSSSGRDDLAQRDVAAALRLPGGKTADNMSKLYEYSAKQKQRDRELNEILDLKMLK